MPEDHKESDGMRFPEVDRSVVTVGSAFGESDEKAFWAGRTPLERLEAVQLYRGSRLAMIRLAPDFKEFSLLS